MQETPCSLFFQMRSKDSPKGIPSSRTHTPNVALPFCGRRYTVSIFIRTLLVIKFLLFSPCVNRYGFPIILSPNYLHQTTIALRGLASRPRHVLFYPVR